MKLKCLEDLATNMVGDGQKQNLFFVSLGKDGVQMITKSFLAAYDFWCNLPKNEESTLEDRRFGVICSVEPIDDDSNQLISRDDSRMFLKSNPTARNT